MLARSLVCLTLLVLPHDGPDPIGSWQLSKEFVSEGRLQSLLGVDGRVEGELTFVDDVAGNALFFDGRTTRVVLADDHATSEQKLPSKHLSVTAWVAINTPTQWGGILGVIQDNGDAEAGWLLGYDEQRFTFALASSGADDGDGMMNYLAGRTRYDEGRFYHVCGTYDGEVMRLYVNGALEAESREQSGAILYPKRAPLVLGGYRDDNEDYKLHGRIRSARLFEAVAKPKAVRDMFEHGKQLTVAAPHVELDPEHRWLVHPYLQWATRTGMTVRWETSRPGSSVVHWGERVDWVGEGDAREPTFAHRQQSEGAHRLHEVRLDGLEPDTAYYYRVQSVDDLGRELWGDVLSFQTAPDPGTPFAFAVISDTQGNPKVSGAVARHAWALRPNFVLHPGDLVSTGTVKAQWLDHFFASMRPLLERVALFPVLGNHERDARFYYDYMSLPDPEYHYTFVYGDAQFFLIDSNRKVGPGSEQFLFLARELKKSRAQWKIVCYHHPAYSSDENDYGNAWSGPSSRGDLRTRKLVPLFDRYGVD
ncbi:MAG: metallophosphoesterase, partial [Planctomycetes bacterium]|nr:metallophosphoesterase [Planctomycetota bacterium]